MIFVEMGRLPANLLAYSAYWVKRNTDQNIKPRDATFKEYFSFTFFA